jgi:hypothetical protein
VNAAIETQTVEVDGLPIRYLTVGEGPPLMPLHGAGDNALDWQWVLPDLGATHRIYAPDLPGSPDSARPTIDYSPAFFARFVVPTFMLRLHGRPALPTVDRVQKKAKFMPAKPALRKTLKSVSPGST